MDLYRSMTRQNSRSNSNSHSHSSPESRSRSRRNNANGPFAGVYVYNPEAESSDEKEDQEEDDEQEPPLSSTTDNNNIYSSSSSSSSSLSKLSSSSSCSYSISSQDENDQDHHDHHDYERNDAVENPAISQYCQQTDFENDVENDVESYHENERTEECVIDAESAWVSSQFQSHSPFNNTLRDGTSIIMNKNSNDDNNNDTQDLAMHGEARAVLATTVVDGERTAPGTTTAFDGFDTNTNTNANTNASYRKHGWIGIGFTIVLAISVLVGIGIWQHNTPLQIHNQTNNSQQMENSTMGNSGNRKNVTTISSMVPTPSPSLVGTKESPPPFAWDSLGDYHESLLQTVLERVESFNINNNNNNNNNGNHLLDAYAWTTRGTPQFEALRFVAYQDGGLEAGGDMGYFNGVVVGGDTQLLLQRLSLLVLYFQTGGGFSWNTIAPQSSTGNDKNGNQNTNQIGNWNDRFRRRRRLFLPTGEDETDDEHDDENDDENDYHFKDSEDWATPGVDECLWTGVICNEENYRVTELSLKEQGLVGRIPLEVWVWLPHLITVDLSKNTLRGSLPVSLLEERKSCSRILLS